MSLAKKANQIEYEIIQSRGKKLFDKHGLEAGKVIRAMAVSKAKEALAKEQPSEEQPEEMNEDKLREMVKVALSKPLEEKKLTSSEKNKKEDIVKAIAKQKGGKDELTSQDYAIAASQAKKLAEIIFQRLKNK